jgi:hypothetical protein
MKAENYSEYPSWRHAITEGGRYLASGTITRDNKLVEASEILGSCETEEEARLVGLGWARAWIDSHG